MPIQDGLKPLTREPRPTLSKPLQVRVFRRDGWLCRWCGKPVIFPAAMRQLERLVRERGHVGRLAYFDPRWRRDAAPLLDHLGAVVDHVKAHSAGGAHDESNFATACNKCNARKSAGAAKEPRRAVKGKYGEPTHWDGLSTVFVVLVQDDPSATPSERAWARAFASASRDGSAPG